jgi:hypothetical protein
MAPRFITRTALGIGAILFCSSLMSCRSEPSIPPTPLASTTAPVASATPTVTIPSTPLPKGMIALYPEREKQTIREVGGGNFVHWPYNTAPFETVSEFNLQTLTPAIVRARMSLDLWEPQNDNLDPNSMDESKFRDEGPNRYTFEMLKRFQQEGKMILVSAWDVPDWMVDFPDVTEKRTIRDGMVDEAAEAITDR